MAEQTPGWHPDPSGRHQHRFWDGTAWTEGVADDGAVSSDPFAPPTGEPGRTPEAPGPGVTVTGSSSRWSRVGAAAAVAVLVLGGAFLLLRDDGGAGGPGASTVDAKDGQPIARTIHLRSGEAVGFEVRAQSKGVKFRVAIAVDRGTGQQIDRTFGREATDPYAGADYSEFFAGATDGRRLLFAGRSRGFFAESFVAPASGTYTLAVRPGQAARLRLEIETQSKPGLAVAYSPVELYRLRRDASYKAFFAGWDRRSQGDVAAFTDFSDPYSDLGSDNQMTDYFSEYSDYLDTDYTDPSSSTRSSGNSGSSGGSDSSSGSGGTATSS